jgi:hypothetical protein
MTIMKNLIKTIIPLLLLILASNSYGQATLPAFWDFTNITTPPTGWWKALSANPAAETYTTNGNYFSAPLSCRMDGTGENVGVHVASKPGKVSWYFRYTGTPGPFNGTFVVEESADSLTWTTAKTYTTAMPATMTKDSFTALSSTRYVRWQFKTKQSGYNVALDDVKVEAAQAGATPEINVFYKGNQLLNGAEIFIGNTANSSISVRNRSTSAALNISATDAKGSDSMYFTLSGAKKVNAGGDSTFTLNFAPSGAAGTKRTSLLIESDDPDNPSFTIRVYAINGNLASEPSGNPAAVTFDQVTAYKVRATIAAGTSNAERFIVLVKKGSAVSDAPQDGKIYEKGMWIGSSRVAYVGAPGSFMLDQVVANTDYFVSVFGFNGREGFENYNSNAGTGKQTTPGKTPGAYYSKIDVNKSSFPVDLRSVIRPHTQIFYSNYAPVFGDYFYGYDTTGGRRIMTCQYSGFRGVYTPPLQWIPSTPFSREHVYPYSWMGISSQDSANYSDLHILVPVHQDSVNAVRSNFPLNELKSVVVRFRDGSFGLDSSGNPAYEPRDAMKGFCARAMFYICATYNRTGAAFTIPSPLDQSINRQSQWVLKRWNRMYPPTNFEITRNEMVADVQKNRNPFIDNPDWACYIDFSTMTYTASPRIPCEAPEQGSSVQRISIREASLTPNPAREIFTLDATAFSSNQLKLRVYDGGGRLVLEQNTAKGLINIPCKGWAKGIYLLTLEGEAEGNYQKLVVE